MSGRGTAPVSISRTKAFMPALMPEPGSPLSSSPTKAKTISFRQAQARVAHEPRRGERRANARLQIAGAASPNRAVDDRAAERIGSLGPGPALRQPRTWTVSVWPVSSSRGPPPSPLQPRPDIRAARREILQRHALGAERRQLPREPFREAAFVSGDARRGDRALEQIERPSFVQVSSEDLLCGLRESSCGVPRDDGDRQAEIAGQARDAEKRIVEPVDGERNGADETRARAERSWRECRAGLAYRPPIAARTRSPNSGRAPMLPPSTIISGSSSAATAVRARATERAVASIACAAARSPACRRSNNSRTSSIFAAPISP